jgi:hypothetical protein
MGSNAEKNECGDEDSAPGAVSGAGTEEAGEKGKLTRVCGRASGNGSCETVNRKLLVCVLAAELVVVFSVRGRASEGGSRTFSTADRSGASGAGTTALLAGAGGAMGAAWR